ncbi:MAG: valine--tRNA ligase [Chitinophagaceae bacterium]
MELSKNFEPTAIEEKWTKHWKEKGYFNSKIDHDRKAFTVVIPPPNVTGVLHMGHTLNETVQDIFVRKARMSGLNACWVPGSDHASIATEAKVVQMLKEKGIDKNDLSREEFLKYAFEWKEKYGGIIYNQVERLGCSVDWNRVSFTMDADYYKAVIKVFVDLYNKGSVYRGARMINWDPAAKTALSDEEVEYKDVAGKLYYVSYKIVDENGNEINSPSGAGGITIATQRPETIMGDTAVCVNPTDERYAHLAGKFVIIPLVNRKSPIIFDEYVDKEFGTGALKVTPAHDINDYNLGLKHNLEVIDTLNEDGTLSEAAQVFVGLDRYIARKKAVEQLAAEGLLIREEDYTTRLGFSQRSNAVVEPRISTQWFVKMKDLSEPALKEVTEGRIKIHPGDKFLATYRYWLENVKDWCISRQLWWGQQIPAWYDEEGRFVVAENQEKAIEIFNAQYSISNAQLKQDPDVLDTWFSSWLWPMEVFKGISNPGNEEIKYYYPTSVLVTGQDIIFFWVARMIMAGMEYMQEKPFSDVYFTGMVRDRQGRKMSKQLGNSPDLLELIDKYGADAVRFGIMISSPAGNDLLFDESSCEQGRNFNNKIWNALKLVQIWDERKATSEELRATSDTANFATVWFENRLNEVRTEVDRLYQEFRLSEALKTIYSLIWDDFCSWYLEWVKPEFEQPIDTSAYNKTVEFFEQLMQLLHPFMPFISEEIYHLLKEQQDDLTVKQYTLIGDFNKDILKAGSILKTDVTAIRDARKKNNIKNSDQVAYSRNGTGDRIYPGNFGRYPTMVRILEKQTNLRYDESRYRNKDVDSIEIAKNEIVVISSDRQFYLHVEKEIDRTAQKTQLQKELEYQKGFLISIETKLSNERFVQNAKPKVVETERKKKADAESKIRAIEESLEDLA